MIYKKLDVITFPWEYKELLKLPVFMKEDIYSQLDEFIEEEKKNQNTIKNKLNGG